MTPERWQQVKAILGEALEVTSPPERLQFIEQACKGDVQLMEEVEALLTFEGSSMII